MPIPEYVEHTLLNAVAATGNSETVDIGPYSSGSIQLTGTFTATVAVYQSNDGQTWVKLGSNLTAAGLTALTLSARYFRAQVDAYTSGNITAVFVAKE